MLRTKKYIIAGFLLLFGLMFVGTTTEASAVGIKVETIPGNPFNDCKGSGICGIRIIITLSTNITSTGKIIPADAEVKGDFLMIRFKEKLGDEFKNADGKFIVPIPSDLKLSEKDAMALGFKELVLAKGDYKVDGTLLKIKVARSINHNTTRSNRN